MMALLKPCAEFNCGELATGTYCPAHTHKKPPNRSIPTEPPAARGYDQAWRKLSERARKLQPFCTDCGTREDLTADHSPEAWARKAAGKTIRLRDITVLCLPCNVRRGAARGNNPRPSDRNLASPRGIGATQPPTDCTAGVQVCVSLPGGGDE